MPRRYTKPKSYTKEKRQSAGRTARRHYTDEFRAHAMLAVEANRGNVELTAYQLDMPQPTLEAWMKGRHCQHLASLRERSRGEVKEALQELMWQTIECVPRKIPEANFSQAMTGIGIMVDKIQILTGNPTAINVNKNSQEYSELEKLVRGMNDDELAQLNAIASNVAARAANPVQSREDRSGPTFFARLPQSGLADCQSGEDAPAGVVS